MIKSILFMLLYRDGMLFTWVNGRRLNTVTYNNNNITLSFDYDNNGLRTRKGNTRYYYDSGKNLVGMMICILEK